MTVTLQRKTPLAPWHERYDERDTGHGTPCWIWRGQPDGSNGYGRVRVNGVRWPAHRAFYERHVGPVPEGLVIDHLCRQTMCVNPAHLEAVTIAENTRRGALPKITESDAAAIRAAFAAYFAAHPMNAKGKPRKRLPQGELQKIADRFGISKWNVIHITRGRSWVN